MAAILEYRLTGGAANADPNASLGGIMSSVEISATALNNLFDNVDENEAVNGDVEYRAIDIYNSGNATAENVEMFMSAETDSPSSQLDFGLDATTQSVADESTAPSGVSFAHYLTGSRLSISNIAAGAAQRVWIRRTITAAAENLANDSGKIKTVYA